VGLVVPVVVEAGGWRGGGAADAYAGAPSWAPLESDGAPSWAPLESDGAPSWAPSESVQAQIEAPIEAPMDAKVERSSALW
jgi:hypothetical protein